jgi:hypothetical protein
MFQIKPKKHDLWRRRNFRVYEYPFSKMIVQDYFEDNPGFLDAVKGAASRANKRLAPRRFSVTIVNNRVLCTRVK